MGKTSRYPYINIMGTMGVGKSTATELLSKELGIKSLEERFSDNLFLPRFYKDMKRWAFHSQTFFLMEKINQTMQTSRLLDDGPVIQDTPIQQDVYSYAAAHHVLGNIDDAEWMLYKKIFETFAPMFPKPTLIVSLEAPANVILARITHRGRGFEQSVELSYLRLLTKLNRDWLHTNVPRDVPVLHVDTKSLNLADDPDAQRRFVMRVRSAMIP